ncbi:hypothetical protein AY606_05865 [Acinetobacter sp. SFB]|uniref:hypothetical protein n=1 Tax=Acinetobacter sp. SFB TaxID=1805634 RepID=UPI0007D85195|nr:hypothetical protein [Acinetobacter sp. SFB]OAL78952.1 hypothetical protein AY606_05865 [Acinetobacter sp. SFB]
MQTNLDHIIFKKQGESAAIAESVEKFLKAQGKKEPVQIPFGQSGISQKVENGYKTGQQNMRDMMTQSISLNRPVLKNTERPLTTDQKRMKFNFDAKLEATLAGKQTFTGKCVKHGLTEFKFYISGKHHCIECRKIIIQRKKEAMA